MTLSMALRALQVDAWVAVSAFTEALNLWRAFRLGCFDHLSIQDERRFDLSICNCCWYVRPLIEETIGTT